MKVIRDEESAKFVFIPIEEEEKKDIAAIAAVSKPEDKLKYGGRSDDETMREDGGGYFVILSFQAGDHENSAKLVLRGSTIEDKKEICRIRDMCYFGSRGLIFLGTIEVEGEHALVVTGKRCQHCGAGMIRFVECEWTTCDACAESCEHHYVRGAVHGGDAGDLDMGEFCDKCGRPSGGDTRKKSTLERHRAAETELGVIMLYPDLPFPFNTPLGVAKLRRVLRGLEKGRDRRVAQQQ